MTAFGATSAIPTSGLPLGGSGDVFAAITQEVMFPVQAMVLEVPTVIELPDPATLCDGKRARFGFYLERANPMYLQITSGATMRIGASTSSADGTAMADAAGDYLEIVAVNDTLWGGIAELPAGAWTLA